MGADIYLRSISENARRTHEPAFKRAVARRDKATDPAVKDEIQKEVMAAYDAMYPEDGYYRDSYNATSLFGVLGLSWWALCSQPIPSKDKDFTDTFINEEGLMGVQAMKALKEIVEAIPFDEAFDKWAGEQLDTQFGVKFDNGDNSRDKWKAYFAQKRTDFLALLDRAIALEEPLYCSV